MEAHDFRAIVPWENEASPVNIHRLVQFSSFPRFSKTAIPRISERSMEHSIRQRLLRAEGDLLDAIPDGMTALDRFRESWMTLQADVDAAVAQSQLCDETIELAHRTASAISLLSDSFLDLEEHYQSIDSSRKSELEVIFSRFSLTDSHPTYHDAPPSSSRFDYSGGTAPDAHSASIDVAKPCPPYIGAAYKWLVKNLHNPYPSTELKESIARSSGSSLKTINAWFTSVRRRIGWTKILRQHFTNCRHDMLTAAYHYLVEDQPNQPSIRLIEYEFLQMRINAEALYAPQFKKSPLAGKLDTVLKDVSLEERERQERAKEAVVLAAQERREQEKAQRRRERAEERVRAASSLPSPASSSRETTVDLSGSEDDATPPPAVAGRKRRASSSSDSSDYSTDAVTNKRAR